MPHHCHPAERNDRHLVKAECFFDGRAYTSQFGWIHASAQNRRDFNLDLDIVCKHEQLDDSFFCPEAVLVTCAPLIVLVMREEMRCMAELIAVRDSWRHDTGT